MKAPGESVLMWYLSLLLKHKSVHHVLSKETVEGERFHTWTWERRKATESGRKMAASLIYGGAPRVLEGKGRGRICLPGWMLYNIQGQYFWLWNGVVRVCVCVCVCVCARARHALSHVPLFVTPRTVARQAPLSMEFSRQECCSGLPFPTPGRNGWRSEKSQRAMPFGQLLTYQVKIFKPNHQTEYNAHPPIHNLLSGLFH